jgi:hypothetical protein
MRLVAYAYAAPDCLYGPGITDFSAICTLVSAVARDPARYQSEKHRVAEAGHHRPEKRVPGDRKFTSLEPPGAGGLASQQD